MPVNGFCCDLTFVNLKLLLKLGLLLKNGLDKTEYGKDIWIEI